MLKSKFDFILLSLVLALGSISVLVIYSINKNLAASQIIFWLIGLLVLAISSSIGYQNWQKLYLGLYFFSVISLLAVLFFAGPVRGSVRWIDLGPFRFQPSEIAKIASIFLLAFYFKDRTAKKLKNLILGFLLILPAFVLIFLEPDIGNALALAAIWFGITLAAGFRAKVFTILLLGVIMLSVFGYSLIAPYQKERIATFINPGTDPLGKGYNIIQAKIAVGSGEFFGRGLGRGSQSQLNFLPEGESDFIFAAIAEQLGFVGAGLLIIIFTAMAVRVLNTAKNSNRYAQLIIIGAFSYLIFQFGVNVGMNMGLVPVTGITLPLVSYGGSSLISTLFLAGVVLQIKRTQKTTYFHIR